MLAALIVLLAILAATTLPAQCGAKPKAVLATYGDVSYRLTNMRRESYDFLGGWIESRISIEELPILYNPSTLAPYGEVSFAWSNHGDAARENTLAYAIGIESRILKRCDFLSKSPMTHWLQHARIYAEYLRLRYTGTRREPWSPDSDWRVGAEVWKEFNIAPPRAGEESRPLRKKLWGELWADCGYHDTGFLMDDYESWIIDAVIRAGLQERWYLMPYLTTQIKASQWYPIYWENKAVVGGGLRMMPFRDGYSEWLRNLRLYAEYLWVATYFRKEPCGVTERDLVIGLNFSYGLWSS